MPPREYSIVYAGNGPFPRGFDDIPSEFLREQASGDEVERRAAREGFLTRALRGKAKREITDAVEKAFDKENKSRRERIDAAKKEIAAIIEAALRPRYGGAKKVPSRNGHSSVIAISYRFSYVRRNGEPYSLPGASSLYDYLPANEGLADIQIPVTRDHYIPKAEREHIGAFPVGDLVAEVAEIVELQRAINREKQEVPHHIERALASAVKIADVHALFPWFTVRMNELVDDLINPKLPDDVVTQVARYNELVFKFGAR